MAVFSEGGTSYPDFYIALFLLALALISTPLNSLVFFHNFKKSSSIARTLYMLLAATDLVACLALPITISVGLLAEKDQQCLEWTNSTEDICENRYYLSFRLATTGERVRGVIVWMLIMFPGHITGFLAMTRYYQIKYPLSDVSRKLVLSFLLFSFCYLPIVLTMFFREKDHDTTYWFTFTQS